MAEPIYIKLPYDPKQIDEDPVKYLSVLIRELENILRSLARDTADANTKIDDHLAGP